MPVHVIPEQELDELKQKTERLNEPSYAFADQHGSSEEKDREITKLTSELQATEHDTEKLKAQQQQHYAQTVGDKGASLAALRTQMVRCRNRSPGSNSPVDC